MKPKIRLRKKSEKVAYQGKMGKRCRKNVVQANEDRKRKIVAIGPQGA
jgi:hypothetical protein